MSLYIKRGNICNFPFETEDDSKFRTSLAPNAVPKFGSRMDIPNDSQRAELLLSYSRDKVIIN